MSDTSRPEPILPPVLLALTAVTGLVDAVSYLARGRVFTANMTGNVVLLGFAVADVQGLSMARSAAALVAFLIGAVIGGRMATAMSAGHRHRWTGIAFGPEPQGRKTPGSYARPRSSRSVFPSWSLNSRTCWPKVQ